MPSNMIYPPHLNHRPILVFKSPNNFNYWGKFGGHIYYITSIFADIRLQIWTLWYYNVSIFLLRHFLRKWQFSKAKVAYRCLHDNQTLFNTIDLISECWDSYFSLHLLHWSLLYLQIHVEVKMVLVDGIG